MIEHGIHTTKATIWVHLFPIDKPPCLYWYFVRHMKEWIAQTKPRLVDGASKNGKITGRGYLAPKHLPFITGKQIPVDWVCRFKWTKNVVTDRQAGLQAQTIVDWFVSRGQLRFGNYLYMEAKTQERQYSGVDFELNFALNFTGEIKCERYLLDDGSDSPNLYVQKEELGHVPTDLVSTDGKITSKITELPSFSDQEAEAIVVDGFDDYPF